MPLYNLPARGTWTPVLTFSTPGDLAVTYSTRSGFYCLLGGGMVFISGRIQTSSFTWTTSAGNLDITGLPIASAAGIPTQAIATTWQGITKASYTSVVLQIAASSSDLLPVICGSGQTLAVLAPADVPSGGTVDFRFAGVYPT